MRTRLALSLVVVGLLAAGALSPPATAGAQSFTYPPECSAYRLGLVSTSDSTKFACAVQRARVDRLNAGALVTRYDSIAASYRFRYAQAAKAETTAATAFANYLATHASKPPATPPPVVAVAASILVRPERVPDIVVGSAPVQLTGTVRDAAGATLSLPVTYSVAPASVATITSTGLLVPIGPGVATVTASTPTAPSIARTLVVTVTAAQPPPVIPPVVVTQPPPSVPPPTPGAPPGTKWTHPFAPLPNGAAFAEFPRDSVPIDVPPPTRTIRVVSLQAAYDTARTGDRLLIPANSTTQDFAAGPTARALWVTIQGTDSTSRINTAIGGSTSAVAVLSRAHHIRFLGPLWITSTTSAANAVFRSYNGETTVADVPHHIILDGVTIDAGANNEARRCAWPDGAYMAIVRSRLLNCASKGGDAQGILITNGPGPYRFEGNYIEGSHQCFMSGGGDPQIPGSIPSDVSFRYNVCEKPAYWHYTTPGIYTGRQRQVKTIIETKNVRRMLIEGNYLHVVYADAQAGFCALFKSTNQDGSAPWSQTSDVTFRYNRCANIASGINLAAHPQGGVPMTRVSVYDNTFDTLSTVGGEGIGAQILDDVVDVVLLHNSFSNATNNAIGFDGAAGVRTVIAANVLAHGDYGVKGSGSSNGAATIARWMPGGLFASNVITSAPDCSVFPLSTVCTPTAALPAVMPIGYDGRPAGANLAAVNAAIARAMAGSVGP